MTLRSLGVAAAVLAVLHAAMALMPQPPFSGAMNLVLFAANLYAYHCATAVLKNRPFSSVVLFVAGYAGLFALTVALQGKKPLFILLLVAYASVFGSRVLLGFFVLFVLSFVVLQPYAFETFVPLVLIYAAVLKARRGGSPFLLACLLAGLLGLFTVLFPLVFLGMQDSAQTLWRALQRAEVRAALGTSLATSAVATLVVALWGIPLAYALAHFQFRGRRLVESLVDLPILVPQSVAGVALVSLLGPGAPLGQGLEQAVGFRVSGSFTGVVVAQVFVAFPFLVKTALTGFEAVPRQLELASRSLGASPARTFFRISLPLASRAIAVGATLAWARAISEFGCIILFASSPVTAPVLVHTEFLRGGASESRPLAVLLLVVCLWIFLLLHLGQVLMPFALRRRGLRPPEALPP